MKYLVLAFSLAAFIGCGGGGGSGNSVAKNPELTYGNDGLPIIDGTYYTNVKPTTLKCSDGTEKFTSEKYDTVNIWLENGYVKSDSEYIPPLNTIILEKKVDADKLNIDGTFRDKLYLKLGMTSQGYRFIANMVRNGITQFVKDGFIAKRTLSMVMTSSDDKNYRLTCSGTATVYGTKVK